MTAPEASITNLQRANTALTAAISLREVAAELSAANFAPQATQLDALAKALIREAAKEAAKKVEKE
jgi:hypothetical protein